MKKLLALLMSMVFILSLAGCATASPTTGGDVSPTAEGQSTPGGEETTEPTQPAQTTKTTLTVGTPELNGEFIWGFGNNSYDKYVKDLTTGAHYYSTYRTIEDGSIILNEVVVKDLQTEENDVGDVTYTYEIHDDLKWSDGTGITAKDYVAQVLFYARIEWTNAGASTASDGDVYVGYKDYHGYTGTEKDAEGNPIWVDAAADAFFAGVKLLDTYKFSVTVSHEELPYFYESYMSASYPICSAVYLAGGDVESGDNGARIVGVDMADRAEEIASGERFAPTITCGPYKFVSFKDQICTLARNEHFKGDYNGELPKFETIVVQNVNQKTDVDSVIAGSIDMVTGVVEGAKIEAAKAADTAGTNYYERNGFGMIAFHTDFGPVADVNTRWALACLVDRSEIIDYVLGGYGGTVDGPFGLASWMYKERKAEVNAAITPIAFNIQKANEYLDKTEYKFESDGTTPFDASKATDGSGYFRHNAAGEKLVINHCGTEDNVVTDVIQIQYKANAPLAGIDFTVTITDFDTMLLAYYDGPKLGDERMYHTFNLAVGFTAVYDPYYSSYHSDFVGTRYNPYQIADAELDRLIMELRTTEPTDREGFADKFVEFVARWNALLPVLPIYSNQYYDVYNNSIGGVATTPFATWAEMICNLYPTV